MSQEGGAERQTMENQKGKNVKDKKRQGRLSPDTRILGRPGMDQKQDLESEA